VDGTAWFLDARVVVGEGRVGNAIRGGMRRDGGGGGGSWELGKGGKGRGRRGRRGRKKEEERGGVGEKGSEGDRGSGLCEESGEA